MADIVAPFDELHHARPFPDPQRICAFAGADVLEVYPSKNFDDPLHLADGARSGEPQ